MYNGQPLLYLATEQQYDAFANNLAQGDQNKYVAFINDTKKIITHGTTFYCAGSDISNIGNTINSFDTRISNIEGLAARIAALEAAMGLINPLDLNSNNIADFIDLLNTLKAASDQTTTTVVNTINNNMGEIDFWYTYPEA